MKFVLAGAMALALCLPAFASDEGIVITSTTKVILGKGGRIVGPFTIYGSNGEKIFDVPAGSSVDSLPYAGITSGSFNSCCITTPYAGGSTMLTPLNPSN